MQILQWFPGHMAVAIRAIKEDVKLVDGVLMILDTRCPYASLNEKLIDIFLNKKILYVLNKCDLVESKDISEVQRQFIKNGRAVVAVSSLIKKSTDFLYNSIFDIMRDKIEENKNKGINKTLRIMVAGIPNTGKSTIINALGGCKKAVTGNKAGVTRVKQWIKINNLELLDTPGTMPPAFDNQVFAKHLAYVGCMNDSNLDFYDLAFGFIKEVSVKYPNVFKTRYGIKDFNCDISKIFQDICINRGFMKKGNEYDYERCAFTVIDDFRKGRLGKIILD